MEEDDRGTEMVYSQTEASRIQQLQEEKLRRRKKQVIFNRLGTVLNLNLFLVLSFVVKGLLSTRPTQSIFLSYLICLKINKNPTYGRHQLS